jgi:DNA-binding MurR/RpiR family transcriptional regulator
LLATIRGVIQQANAIILAACGSDERLCLLPTTGSSSSLAKYGTHALQPMGFRVDTSRHKPCRVKASGEVTTTAAK